MASQRGLLQASLFRRKMVEFALLPILENSTSVYQGNHGLCHTLLIFYKILGDTPTLTLNMKNKICLRYQRLKNIYRKISDDCWSRL